MPIFTGPRQMTGTSGSGRKNPSDITRRFGPPLTGAIQPSPATGRALPRPSMRGTLGPCTSTSSRPTLRPVRASPTARFTATVLLPTPPLPLNTTSFAPTRPAMRTGVSVPSTGPATSCPA